MPPRVLIADDEEFERRALRQILASAGPPELEIVEAANGREALERAGDARLDAALLDIRMPGIDGIEAARVLRERFPELPIVFLTAYDSFEYARNALRLRVEDFLLKPASSEEVVGALRRALAAAGGGRPATSAVKERLDNAISYLADELRADLAAGRVPADKAGRYLDLEGRRGSVRAVVSLRAAHAERGDAHAEPGSEARRRASHRAAAELFERELSAPDLLAVAGAGPEQALGVLAGEAPWAADEEELASRLEALVERARADLGLALSAGAAYSADPAAPAAYSADRAAPASSAAAAELSRTAQRASSLAGPGRPVVLRATLGRGEGARQTEEAAGRAGSGALAGRRTAMRALDLMESRQAEALSLEGVAAELGVSPSHLSRLLGRHAGLGFADCLARFRVERAKSLLSGGSASIKEIASLVGFHDPAYFARVFRRFEGTSPAEYRARLTAGPGGAGRDEEER